MPWGFEEGRIYNRRKDIHAPYGGQQQGGIITPIGHSLVVCITGDEGEQHGYSDRMRSDGVFEYFGEGQVGDMQMLRGNKHIRDHAENGKDLLLFRKTKEGLRFLGQYVYEADHTERSPDREGAIRDAIVFELRHIDAINAHEVEPAQVLTDAAPVSLEELRERALAAASATPGHKKQTSTVFERSAAVRAYVLARSRGRCEDCGDLAPFETPSGQPFLEAHHVRRLTDGGPDDPRFVIATCPNCHRRAHFGKDAGDCNARMLGFLKLIECMQ
ncbi:HNH endonuclease [Pseudoruegeria sp. SK021]|uniref:HNH endonuclease n=1 Tax=Pseudoruegeria sp. SK021 TaxID=1933035 RepID=UPI000A22B06D|nr:HNH endonuclease [Pseudoruegeria sp. SK021]OSP53702.1 HNH endonuclease [Pseudoruegeria sp. SK021]